MITCGFISSQKKSVSRKHIYSIKEEERANLSYPINVRENQKYFYQRILLPPSNHREFISIKNVYLLDYNTVIDKLGKLVSGLPVSCRTSNTAWKSRLYLRRKIHNHGNSILIASKGAECYYHWMYDIIPRLQSAEKIKADHIISQCDNSFQKETLLKATNLPVVALKKRCIYQCDELTIPSMPGPSGMPTYEAVQFLRKKFLPNKKQPQNRKIYISRSDTKKRIISNEKTLVALLKQYGFQIFTLSGMKVKEQAELFSTASCVIAAHGASLSNLAFCNPSTNVIEIFHDKYVHWCYWMIACHAQANYFYSVSSAGNIEHDPRYAHSDIVANVDEIEKILLESNI
jgi:hypothetical protein